MYAGISDEFIEEYPGDPTIIPARALYVPVDVNDYLEMDYGLVIGLTLSVLSIVLILLAAVSCHSVLLTFSLLLGMNSTTSNRFQWIFQVGLVVYSKIVQQRRPKAVSEEAPTERK